MKIQINGFDIEVNTEESNMTVKVLDSTGKELSNNTYTQTLPQNDDVVNVDIPSAEETPAQPAVQEVPAQGEPVQAAQPVQGEDVPVQTGESFIPDFETFKKLRKDKKI